MENLRVVMAGLPRMLREIVRARLDSEPGVRVVGESGAADRVVAMVTETEADVVVLGVTTEPSRREVCEVLALREELRMLTVGNGGREIRVYELVSTAIEATADGLVRAIRGEDSAPGDAAEPSRPA